MYLAIDIGGTKTLLAVFTEHGKLVESIRFETPKDYQAFIKQLSKSFLKLKNHSELVRCVVGAPGLVNRKTNTVVAFGNLSWENIPLGRDIKAICHLSTTVENDANLAGLSEATLVKHGYRKVLYITISTGIGGVVIIDGAIDEDYADMEFGSMMFEHDGKLQKWEEFASGRAIVAKFGKRAGDIPAEDTATWYEISRNITLGLSGVIANLTPEVIIIGGGVGTNFDKFADRLHEELMIFGSKLTSVPPLRKAVRTEEAVIYGCYELAHQLEHKK